MTQVVLISIIIYIVLQLLNVISSTIKSLALIKSGPMVAGLINAVSYTLSAVVVKLITDQEMWVILVVTFITNLAGVPLGKLIMDKFEKEKLWVYEITIKGHKKVMDDIREKLNEEIDSYYTEIKKDKLYELKIFAHTKENSSEIKRILAEEYTDAKIKYHIVQPR